jgi:LAS superfamily LD-carboxypeptidase LdcB
MAFPFFFSVFFCFYRMCFVLGFRTYARQQYFWHCYQTKSCNNGNIAAYPGTSNHGVGLALDIHIPNYAWMKAHAHSFGFVRTVRSET